MALSALSAGLLISCVNPADDNKAADVDSQKVVQESFTTWLLTLAIGAWTWI